MHVDPPYASAVQLAVADERIDISVRDNWYSASSDLRPPFVADEELTIDEIMGAHFIAAEKLI